MPNYSEHIKFLREGKPTESELKVLRSEKEYFCSCQASTEGPEQEYKCSDNCRLKGG